MDVKKKKAVKKAYFRPIHFFILLAIDAIVVAGIVVPQQSNIASAQEELEKTQDELNAVKIEYERQQENLEYMKTNDYKLQQGSAKYGWHYKDDAIIYDNDNTSLTGNTGSTGSTGLATSSPSPSASASPSPSASPAPTPSAATAQTVTVTPPQSTTPAP